MCMSSLLEESRRFLTGEKSKFSPDRGPQSSLVGSALEFFTDHLAKHFGISRLG